MAELSYEKAADWRAQLRLNRHRTVWVIGLFFLIYLLIGLAIDVALLLDNQQAAINAQNIQLALSHLASLQPFPIFTLLFIVVAAISLLVTIKMHNKLMLLGTEAIEITAENTDLEQKQLYNVVEEMKVAAGLQYMPRVYIINAEYMNAFASGYSEKSAMVAITRGLLTKLNRAELQAVMAHELSHIRHQDIKLTLMAAVLTNLIVIAIDLVFRGMLYSSIGRRKENNNGNALLLVVMLLRFLLPLLTILLTFYLSRTRELMADAGCVELTRSGEPLAQALLKIHQDHEQNTEKYQQAYQQTAHEDVRLQSYIYTPSYARISASSSLSALFSTHPSLEKRLTALGFKTKKSAE